MIVNFLTLGTSLGLIAFILFIVLAYMALFDNSHASSEKKPPLIFLDFDGVLNNREWLAKQTDLFDSKNHFDPDAIRRLNSLVAATGAEVVVSSSWRIWNVTKYPMERLLQSVGFKYEILGTTPVMNCDEHRDDGFECSDAHRGYEIDTWLTRNNAHDRSFVIIDDDSDMAPHGDRLVQTSMSTGLKMEHFCKALAVINIDPRDRA
jgi:histidinol phosphatase-like enzyme